MKLKDVSRGVAVQARRRLRAAGRRPGHNQQDDSQAALESLETRLLLAHTPWGAIPTLLGQNLSNANFPSVNGTGESIVMIDTGVDYFNSSLGGGTGPHFKVRTGFNFVDGNGDISDTDPTDTDGHGTIVAGILGANEFVDGGAIYQGVAPRANIIVLDVDNGIDNPSDAIIGQALQWVVDNRTRFNIVSVNVSEGNGDFYNSKTAEGTYSSQLANLFAHGVLVAASSGNAGGIDGTEYPSSDPSVISVGSVNSANQLSRFTSTGNDLNLLAPGQGVTSTWIDPSGDSTYLQGANGTSFSAPYVAGLAALIKQLEPTYGVARVMSIIDGGAVMVKDTASGLSFPSINIYNSLKLLQRTIARSTARASVTRSSEPNVMLIKQATSGQGGVDAALARKGLFSDVAMNDSIFY